MALDQDDVRIPLKVEPDLSKLKGLDEIASTITSRWKEQVDSLRNIRDELDKSAQVAKTLGDVSLPSFEVPTGYKEFTQTIYKNIADMAGDVNRINFGMESGLTVEKARAEALFSITKEMESQEKLLARMKVLEDPRFVKEKVAREKELNDARTRYKSILDEERKRQGVPVQGVQTGPQSGTPGDYQDIDQVVGLFRGFLSGGVINVVLNILMGAMGRRLMERMFGAKPEDKVVRALEQKLPQVPKPPPVSVQGPVAQAPKFDVPTLEQEPVRAPKFDVPTLEQEPVRAPKFDVPTLEQEPVRAPKPPPVQDRGPVAQVPKFDTNIPTLERADVDVPVLERVPEPDTKEVPVARVPEFDVPTLERVPEFDVEKLPDVMEINEGFRPRPKTMLDVPKTVDPPNTGYTSLPTLPTPPTGFFGTGPDVLPDVLPYEEPKRDWKIPMVNRLRQNRTDPQISYDPDQDSRAMPNIVIEGIDQLPDTIPITGIEDLPDAIPIEKPSDARAPTTPSEGRAKPPPLPPLTPAKPPPVPTGSAKPPPLTAPNVAGGQAAMTDAGVPAAGGMGGAGAAIAIAAGVGIAIMAVQKLFDVVISTVATASPAMAKIWKMTMEDISGVIGQTLMPVMEIMQQGARFFGDILATVLPSMEEMGQAMAPLREAWESLRESMSGIFATVGPIMERFLTENVEFFGMLMGDLAEYFEEITPLIEELIPVFTYLSSVWRAIIGTGIMVVFKTLVTIMSVVVQGVTALVKAFNDFMSPVYQLLQAMGIMPAPLRGKRPGMEDSTGAAAREARISDVSAFLQQLQTEAFRLPGAQTNYPAQTVSTLQLISQTLSSIFQFMERTWGVPAPAINTAIQTSQWVTSPQGMWTLGGAGVAGPIGAGVGFLIGTTIQYGWGD